MNRELLQDTFLGMLQIMKADLDKLSSVADDAAREEATNLLKSGKGNYTTSPKGHDLSHAGTVHSMLTVPMAMTCFSMIDLLGKILVGNVVLKEDVSSKDSGDFIKHARAFENFAGKDYLKNEKPAQIFQDAFRHSMAHGFLPGATKKVAFHVSYHYQLWEEPLFLNDDPKVYILNVKCLTAVTKAGVGKLADMAGQQGITEQLKQILDAFAKVVTEEEEKLSHLDS